MTEPRTEAGKRMLGDYKASGFPGSLSHQQTAAYIAAIEDEAAAVLRADIEALPVIRGTGTMYVGVQYVELAAVLALIPSKATE